MEQSVEIQAPASVVWEILTQRQYTDQWVGVFSNGGPAFHIESEWFLGSKVHWKDPEGKVLVEGTVTALVSNQLLRFTVFDVRAEKFEVTERDGITFMLEETAAQTVLFLSQGDFGQMKDGQKYCQMTEQIWAKVLPVIKKLAETTNTSSL